MVKITASILLIKNKNETFSKLLNTITDFLRIFFFFSLQAVHRAASQRWRARCTVCRTLFDFRHLRAGGELLLRTNNSEINVIFVNIKSLKWVRNIHLCFIHRWIEHQDADFRENPHRENYHPWGEAQTSRATQLRAFIAAFVCDALIIFHYISLLTLQF